ncbi:membrane-associated phospholipid phosphatase [Gracilibacillus boraciitolerans JCM 21714]|uniref:Membrane-associated phospholipid phosphatase n=1 Tax=Gracilibacillus boraciitolerans JCM 21714 TaxID=1298598 RepID=W4VKG5_9BACI|nr:phosphatase PAP2 family protein [Gracilibacillus boraciitolerans]GAE93313.1 membrane-associated phospholipid phosphatase [Gracilibacillus boraciitolerans JCM 21714]
MRIKDVSKAALITFIIGFLTIITMMTVFVELAEDVLEKEKFEMDHYFLNILVFEQNSLVYQTMEFLTEAGSVLFLTIASVLIVLFLLITRQNKWYIIFFIINMIGISAFTKVLKLIFERDRPELIAQYDGTGFSFPSGHSTGSIAFYGFLIYLLWKKVSHGWMRSTMIIIVGLFAVLIPFSRVVLGVHYFTDILAGILLGLTWLITCIILLEYLIWRRNIKKVR